MYVCLCEPVTDRQIREVVCSGAACSVRQLQAQLGIAKKCKKCARAACDIVNETLASVEATPMVNTHTTTHVITAVQL